jgi:hypothetical protein
MHLKSKISDEENPIEISVKIYKLRKLEKWIFTVVVIIAAIYILTWLGFNITTLVFSWKDWHPLLHKDDWEPRWKHLTEIYIMYFNIGAGVGILMNIGKIILGILLLIKMKKQLNYFYFQNRWKIILTIIMGIISSIWKVLLNYYTPFLGTDLKFNYAATVKIEDYALPYQAIVMIIDILLPIWVILSNINSTDFDKYIFNLMRGRQLTKYYLICSFFIRSRRSLAYTPTDLENFINGDHMRFAVKSCDPGSFFSEEFNRKTYKTIGESFLSVETSDVNQLRAYKSEFLSIKACNSQIMLDLQNKSNN